MKKKGLTIIELIVAIFLLGVIMAAVSTVFSVALKSYHVSFAQSTLQREANLVVDSILRETKQAVSIPETLGETERSETVLILALPAMDEDNNFIYSGGLFEKDYLIYYLEESELRKKVSASPQSTRYSQDGSDRALLDNVSSLAFSFTPAGLGEETVRVDASITASRIVSRTNVKVEVEGSATKRNYE